MSAWWHRAFTRRRTRPGARSPLLGLPPEPAQSTFGENLTFGDLIALDALPDRARRLRALADTDQTVSRTLTRLRDQVNADLTLMRATRRWRPGLPDPATFVPGDVVVLRSLATQGLVTTAVNTYNALGAGVRAAGEWNPAADSQATRRLRAGLYLYASTAAWTLDAVPYFLPVTTAVGILASHPPDPDLLTTLRLPFPVVTVYFGADLAFDERFLRWSSTLGRPERREPVELAARVTGQPIPTPATSDLTTAIRDLGGYLTGVTLFAGEHGGIAEDVAFVVAANPDPDQTGAAALDRVRGVIPGRLSRSTLQPLVANLAAAVSWGSWTQPTANTTPLAPPGTRAWRKAITSPQHRHDERRGAFAAVRVLDTARTARAAATTHPAGDDAMARRSPATHLRRGHWRRVRVGPRHDWHYEGRWIAPAVVSPGGQPAAGVAVYRLPVPDAARPALGVDTDDPTGIPASDEP